jgi:hypothetical protein
MAGTAEIALGPEAEQAAAAVPGLAMTATTVLPPVVVAVVARPRLALAEAEHLDRCALNGIKITKS